MKRCDQDGCPNRTDTRWCAECWAAFEDFVRDGGRPGLVAEMQLGEQDANPTMLAWLKQERGDQ